MFLIYSLVFVVCAFLLAPYYAWRYRKTSYLRRYWRERLGFLPVEIQPSRPGAIWVHAVSVGETLAVAGLVEALAGRRPERDIFMSHITPTGREMGEKRLPKLAGRFYLPLDLSRPLRRVMKRLQPAMLLIVETELWPSLLRTAHEYGVRVVVVNARLSDRSLRGYRFFRPLMKRVLSNVDLIIAQTPGDAERFREIGARPERVLMMGNLKFDVQPPSGCEFAMELKNALASLHRAPVLVAASTMPGEEELVLRAWSAVRCRFPRALLILAPRHPARFDQVADLFTSHGHALVKRSSLAGEKSELCRQLATAEVLLLDSLGELAAVFEHSDAVFMGGSMVPTGGHNLLEAAWWGKPVVFGPHMENFRDAARTLLAARAAIQVRNASELEREIIGLLEDDERRRAIGEAAREVVRRGSGAGKRVLERIEALLDETHAKGAAG